MAIGAIERIGHEAKNLLAAFGDFCRFVGKTFLWMGRGYWRWKNLREVFPQMFEVGTKSVPVISVTGAFIGMVLAVEAYTQFKSIGQETRLGSIINVSVLKQIGPGVTAGVVPGGGRGVPEAGAGGEKSFAATRAPPRVWGETVARRVV